ncbi:MAG: hypothetical protein DCF22_22155, partial [Leptolyngbya sp.]
GMRASLILDGAIPGFLRHPLSQASSEVINKCIREEVLEIQKAHQEGLSSNAYLVFIREEESSNLPMTDEFKRGDFIICFSEVYEQVRIQADSNPYIRTLLSALALSKEGILRIQKIHDSVVFIRDDGRIVYPLFPKVGVATAFISDRINEELIKPLLNWYEILSKDKEFERASRLLVSSLHDENDKSRSFLAAWNALEILVNKSFEFYESYFFQEIEKNYLPNVLPQFIDLIRNVTKKSNKENYPWDKHENLFVLRQNCKSIRSEMKGKYNLSFKFALIASSLSWETAEESYKEFMQAKNERDNLAHGKDIVEEGLPVKTVQKLFCKYLQLHLNRLQASRPKELES